MDQSFEKDCHQAVVKAAIEKLHARFLRVQSRKLVIFRVLRLRMIARKMQILLYGK